MRTARGTEAGLKGVAFHVTAPRTGPSNKETPVARRAGAYMMSLRDASEGDEAVERIDESANKYPDHSRNDWDGLIA